MTAPGTHLARRPHAIIAIAALTLTQAMPQVCIAGPVSSRAQDPQAALAESAGLALAMRMQNQQSATAAEGAASAATTSSHDKLNPSAVVVKNGSSSLGQDGGCAVNFVPLPTAAYNKGLRGAPASTAPTYVISKGNVVLKC